MHFQTGFLNPLLLQQNYNNDTGFVCNVSPPSKKVKNLATSSSRKAGFHFFVINITEIFINVGAHEFEMRGSNFMTIGYELSALISSKMSIAITKIIRVQMELKREIWPYSVHFKIIKNGT